jgi:hypothetical protein
VPPAAGCRHPADGDGRGRHRRADTVTNVVVVDAPGDGNPGNDTDSETTPVGPAPVMDVAIAKTDNGVSVAPGGSLTYTCR